MTRRAWIHIWGTLLAAVAISAVAITQYGWGEPEWPTLLALTGLATIAQLFEAEHGKQSYYPHFVFFFAAVVLLQPAPLLAVIVVPHLLEWAKARLTNAPHLRDWYIQPFNISAHVVPALAAQWVYNEFNTYFASLPGLAPMLAAAFSVVTYIGLNHVMVGGALALARGVPWHKSRVLKPESLLPDIVMSLLGYVVAVLWALNPWLILPALSPLVLMYQALLVPQLREDAQTDGKTGLFNARHFAALFKAEMERAKRFDRPLSVIMADLDLLRNINNTYGHMAGDVVLAGIGKLIRDTIREYDMAGRFGGEEFIIALPETPGGEACIVAERLRQAVETAKFDVSTSPTPIQATMSIGVAAFPNDATEGNELIHEADVAVYQAKLNGRNCVVPVAGVPHYVKLGIMSITDRLTPSMIPTFVPRPVEPTSLVRAREPEVAQAAAPSQSATQFYMDGRQQAGSAPYSGPDLSTDLGAHDTPAWSKASSGAASPARSALESQSSGALWAGLQTSEFGNPKSKIQSPKSSRLPPFVASVAGLGSVVALAGVLFAQHVDILGVVLFMLLAAAVELLQIDVYGENTVSASVAVIFCASLLQGIPGAAAVSLAIALAHYVQMRPALYKTAFNWATHLLAGLAPAGAMWLISALGRHVPYQIGQLRLDAVDFVALLVASLISGMAYFLIESGLVAAAISLSRGASVRTTWQQQFAWLSMHYVVLTVMGLFLSVAYTVLGPLGVLVFSLPVLMMRFSQKQYVERTADSMRELKRMNEQLNLANREVIEASKAISALNEELFETLARIIDARDPYVCNHASQVANYAMAIGIELGLPQQRVEHLRQAGFLHDIGKIGISEVVLHKPERLTPEEYDYIKTHAPLGGEFLDLSGGLRHLASFVRHHHERWDGTGYPDGLKGEEIPLEARILCVCDSVEAMTSDRPYHEAIPVAQMVAEVKRCSGTQFDPAVAEAFIRVVERQEQMIVNSGIEARRRYEESNPLARSNARNIPTLTSPLAPLVAMSMTTEPLTGLFTEPLRTAPRLDQA